MARTIQVPVTFGIPKRKADGSVKLEMVTNYEVSTDDYMLMDSYRQTQGWCLYRENEFNDDDVPQDDVKSDLKSPSQRLRDTLYVYHMQTNGDASSFRRFYESQIEEHINKVKERLE